MKKTIKTKAIIVGALIREKGGNSMDVKKAVFILFEDECLSITDEVLEKIEE